MIKNVSVSLAAVLAAVLLGAAQCGSDVTPGGRCDQEGAKHKNSNGHTYVCKQVPGGNRIWQQEGTLTPDRP